MDVTLESPEEVAALPRRCEDLTVTQSSCLQRTVMIFDQVVAMLRHRKMAKLVSGETRRLLVTFVTEP